MDPAPSTVIVVLSGAARPQSEPAGYELIHAPRRLGFAPAVNLGLRRLIGTVDRIGLLNDDTLPPERWLAILGAALDANPRLAAVQGTVVDGSGELVDGRGIALDPYAVPVQIDRGRSAAEESDELRPVLAVSGTAALFRAEALRLTAEDPATILEPSFGSYHEDLDLGLRLLRLDWSAAWVGGAPTRHQGSASGQALRWRHPWWILANRWRAFASNLSPTALIRSLPRLFRGELRALNTMSRTNPRAIPVGAAVTAALPLLIAAGWRRRTSGPRLDHIPGVP
jgi:GT2 family glycosyltransferase